jgi:hypothetical protein
MQKSLVQASRKRNRFDPEETETQEPSEGVNAVRVSLVTKEFAALHDKEIVACILATD